MIKKLVSIALFCAICISLISCDNASSGIVGKWEDNKELIEFKKDGTFTASYYWLGGSYVIDGDTLTLAASLTGKETYTYELIDDTLYLYTDSGKVKHEFTGIGRKASAAGSYTSSVKIATAETTSSPTQIQSAYQTPASEQMQPSSLVQTPVTDGASVSVAVLVEPMLESINGSFREGRAFVNKGVKIGYIDKTGKVVVPCEYDVVNLFIDGLALVGKGSKYGYIDRNGNVIISLEYDYLDLFNEGLALVVKDNKRGFIDKTGKVVIPFRYDYALGFSEGLAVVVKDSKYGFIDKTGELVIPFEYEGATSFHEGLALVLEDGVVSLIDKTATTVIEFENIYDDINILDENLLSVLKDGKWGIINKTGNLVLPLEYDWQLYPNEGLFRVGKDDKYGFINTVGKLIVPVEYDSAYDFSEGFAAVKSDGKWGFVDKTGRLVIPVKYDDVSSFSNGLAVVAIDGKHGYIDIAGRLIVPLEYESALSFNEGLAVVKKEGKYGILQIVSSSASNSNNGSVYPINAEGIDVGKISQMKGWEITAAYTIGSDMYYLNSFYPDNPPSMEFYTYRSDGKDYVVDDFETLRKLYFINKINTKMDASKLKSVIDATDKVMDELTTADAFMAFAKTTGLATVTWTTKDPDVFNNGLKNLLKDAATSPQNFYKLVALLCFKNMNLSLHSFCADLVNDRITSFELAYAHYKNFKTFDANYMLTLDYLIELYDLPANRFEGFVKGVGAFTEGFVSPFDDIAGILELGETMIDFDYTNTQDSLADGIIVAFSELEIALDAFPKLANAVVNLTSVGTLKAGVDFMKHTPHFLDWAFAFSGNSKQQYEYCNSDYVFNEVSRSYDTLRSSTERYLEYIK